MTREEDMIKRAIDYEWRHQDDMVDPADSFMLRDAYCNGWKAADAHPQSPWISVEDRLPEEGVLIFAMTRTVTENAVFCGFLACKYTDGKFLHENNYSFSDNNGEFFKMSNKIVLNDVTRWMPIPELQTTK